MRKIIVVIILTFSIGKKSQAQITGNDTLDIIKKTYNQLWELGDINQKGTFRLVSYKPIYVTAGRISNNPNEKPKSEDGINLINSKGKIKKIFSKKKIFLKNIFSIG